MTKHKKVVELIESNEKQKLDKELKLAEQAKQEQEEYSKIIEKQLKDMEFEKKKEEDTRRLRYEHNENIR
jgi:hypothetical protein